MSVKPLTLPQSVDYHVLHGDCLAVLPGLAAESVDAIVTDPPYGLAFMGKDWDHGVPGEHFWREALRVAKPGAHLLAFGGSRTVHRLAVAIEDAGWEIRDTIMWLYGSGFPKSKDASKAIDTAAGAEREIVGESYARGMRGCSERNAEQGARPYEDGVPNQVDFVPITAPATPDAIRWAGWGTALKPAHEPIIVARKPLQGTVAANVVKWGTGAINVDGCRVAADPAIDDMLRTTTRGKRQSETWENGSGFKNETNSLTGVPANGRWPANVVHDGSEEVLRLFPNTGKASNPKGSISWNGNGVGHEGWRRPAHDSYTPTEFTGYGDTGSAARFFYCAKASKRDRDEGLERFEGRKVSYMNTHGGNAERGEAWSPIDERTGNERDRFAAISRNHHPTVKPTALMQWLVRLVTPPGGTILDPFCGSGSTGKAAMLEGFRFVGIEQDAEYVEIAKARIAFAVADKTFGLFDMPEYEDQAQAAD